VPMLQSLTRLSLRVFAALLGLGLLVYLVFRAGPGAVWKQVHTVGWGLALIIILGGFSQLIRTCAWRQTFMCDIRGLSWSRSFGAQLASDACGQLGLAGKLLGDAIRVSLLGSTVPLPGGISACAIDGGLHTLTAAVVTALGIIAALLLAPLSGGWRVHGLLLAAVLSALVVLAAVAVARRWQLMGKRPKRLGDCVDFTTGSAASSRSLIPLNTTSSPFLGKRVPHSGRSWHSISFGTQWLSWRSISSYGLWEQGSPW